MAKIVTTGHCSASTPGSATAIMPSRSGWKLPIIASSTVKAWALFNYLTEYGRWSTDITPFCIKAQLYDDIKNQKLSGREKSYVLDIPKDRSWLQRNIQRPKGFLTSSLPLPPKSAGATLFSSYPKPFKSIRNFMLTVLSAHVQVCYNRLLLNYLTKRLCEIKIMFL